MTPVPVPREVAPLAQALVADAGTVLGSGPFRAYLALQAVAGGYLIVRRGPGMVPLLAVIAAGAVAFAIVAWFAGRSARAHPEPDPVRAPRLEMAAVALGYLALQGWFLGWWPPGPWPPADRVFLGALLGWAGVAAAAWAGAARRGALAAPELAWVFRGWLPLVPLLIALVLPKLPGTGLGLFRSAWQGLRSGVTQQILLQVGLFARLEAVLGRTDASAVLAAVGFGAVHVSTDLPQAGGDWWIALANAMVLQSTIGLVFCLAFLRHRAPLALGVCHAFLQA